MAILLVSVCGPKDVTVMHGDKYNERVPVENVLTRAEKELPDKDDDASVFKQNYWLGPNRSPASFVLNLGCRVTFIGVKIINTHNRWYKDRATKQFK